MSTISVKCFFNIIRKELYLFRKEFINSIIDLAFEIFTWVIVFGYLMTNSGLNNHYGSFILIGAIAVFSFFGIIWKSMSISQDISDNKFSNFIILPIPTSLVFISIAISWAIGGIILSICLLPIGQLILLSKFKN